MAVFTKKELERAYEVTERMEQTSDVGDASPTRLASWIWDQCEMFFSAMFASVWSGFLGMFTRLWEITIGAIEHHYGKASQTTIDVFLGHLSETGLIDRDDANSLRAVKNLPFPVNALTAIVTLMIVWVGWLKIKCETMLGTTLQTLNKIHTPVPPSPRDVMMAAFVAPEKTGEIRDAMKRAGISDGDIDLMFLGVYRIYGENEVRTLWLRGVLSDDQMYMRMRELGYTDTRTKELIQGWPIIPGPSDLFHLVAKEAFEPTMIAKMGLDDEFPEAQVDWLKKQGISEDWARKYWYAHWDQPSIQMGYEMLHRGVINYEDLDMLFRTIEIPPFWREKLTKIAFQPYTRVDTRRMHKLGVLNDEELLSAYMDQGYDEEKAKKMALFTIRYNLQTQKSLTRAQIEKGYKEDLITKEDIKDLLLDLDYKEAQADYMIAMLDYQKEKEYQDELVDQIGDRYVNNLLEEFEARNQLGQLNLPGRTIEILIGRWNIKRFTDRKLPSKSDLDKMLKAKIIDKDKYLMEMLKLGYNYVYIDWYLKLAEMKRS